LDNFEESELSISCAELIESVVREGFRDYVRLKNGTKQPIYTQWNYPNIINKK